MHELVASRAARVFFRTHRPQLMTKKESHRRGRRLAPALAIPLLAAALAACTDRQPLAHAGGASPRMVENQHAEWRGYWRDPLEFWVYDMTPEIGINSAFGESAILQNIRGAGMRLVRHGLPWGAYASDPTGYQGADALAAQHGIEYVMVVSGPRDSAMQATNPATAAERQTIYDQLATDMENMVRLYPHFRFYQLFNEVDAACEPGKFFNGSNSSGNSTYLSPNRYVQGRNYADMLRTVYPRMKAAARAQGRDVWVLMTGLTGKESIARVETVDGLTHCIPGDAVSWEFARGVYENGGKAYFDVAAIHTYGPTAVSTSSMLELSHAYTWQLNAVLGDPNRPLWVTEFGSSAASSQSLLSPTRDQSRDGIVIDSIQRRWYEDATSVQRDGNHLQKILGFTYATSEGGTLSISSGIGTASPWDYSLGVFRGDKATPRPAFQFLQGRASTNSLPETRGTRTGTFRVRTSGQVPMVHPYYYDGQDIVIQDVRVNALVPTAIPMCWPEGTSATGLICGN